ncbi:MAG: tyrosine-type recombinase/integrase [bacterium]
MPNWIITPDKYLSEEEISRLIKVCSDAAELASSKGQCIAIRDYMIIDLALNTGLRVQELSDLKVEDLHINYGESALTVQNGKGGKKRIVKFGKKTKAHLKRYLAERHSKSEYLFYSSRGDKLERSAIQKTFKKWAKKSRLSPNYSIHSLRHTHATRLYKASGNNLRMVQKQLGHSNIQTTTVYSDVSKNVDSIEYFINIKA